MQWLTDELLPYFEQWLKSVNEREGFSVQRRGMMMISQETLTGIKVNGKTNS